MLLMLVPERMGKTRWELPAGVAGLESALLRRKARAGDVVIANHLQAQRAVPVLIMPCKTSGDTFPSLSQARTLVGKALEHDPDALSVLVHGFDAPRSKQLGEAVLSALLAALARMPARKKKPAPAPRLQKVLLAGVPERIDVARVKAEANGNHLARWLTALPPNELNPAGYRKHLTRLAREHGWQFSFLGEKELARRGAGAFLAVSQASANRDAGIARLGYRPGRKTSRPSLSLVGKGVCFDTGGHQLKPFKSMLDMHQDMAGSAVAVGVLQALTDIDYPHPVDCLLAITENRIGPAGYSPQDIITASDGTTIQAIHTDAEGRLVLADTLALASSDKPRAIIDFATLTGTCVSALTERYSGVFTNREQLHPLLIESGKSSGERVWPFPMDEDFDKDLESEVADIMQCAVHGEGDHILGARFLRRFAGERQPWIHVDLSACHHKGGLAHVPTSITGFGVRFTLNLLVEQDLLGKLAKL